MINAPVIRAVENVLHKRGIEQRPGERLGDFVARGLGISESQAETFLACLHEGASLQQAEAQAGINIDPDHHTLLIEIARAIGVALGRVSS
jgi:hypothetical protein